MITPDLKQNIFYTIYFILLHNWQVIIYGALASVSLLFLIIKPSRSRVLLFLGFLILIFSFEYDKHIREDLHQQTVQSLITVQPHYKVERIIRVVILKGAPILLPLSGWSLVGLGLVLSLLPLLNHPVQNRTRKRNNNTK